MPDLTEAMFRQALEALAALPDTDYAIRIPRGFWPAYLIRRMAGRGRLDSFRRALVRSKVL